MMSAAISTLAGLEQTKVGPVSGDPSSGEGELEDFSFAKSLSESVGVPAPSKGKNAADDLAIASPGLKGTTLTKQLDEVAEKAGGAKEKPSAAQEMHVHSELKGAVAEKNVPPQTTTVTGAQEKITADYAGMKKVGFPGQVEGTSDDVSSIPDAPAAGATDEGPGPQVSIADGGRPLVPLVLSGDSPVVQKETEAAEKMMDASSKKTDKTQESSATQKTVQKTVGKIVDAIAVEPKPVMGISTESAISVAGQAVAPTVALQSGVSKATDPSSEAVSSVTKPSTGISAISVDGQVRKEASRAKASVTDTAMTVTAGSDPVASPKTDMGRKKTPAVAIPGGSDGENKPQAVREFGATLLHATGIAPTAVMPGTISGELVATRLPVGDAGGHTAGLSAGSREQDGAGVVAQSMDGTPRMLAATPTSLEVGIQNGTHGWLKVRAEMTDGGFVNASVSATSSAGQEMLRRELPALTAYLQEEKVGVNAVVVHAPSTAGADLRSSSGTDGAGGQTPQRSNEEEQQPQGLRKTALNGSEEAMTYHSLLGVGADGSLPLAADAGGGSWLSVRA